jgi:hypothetical protein
MVHGRLPVRTMSAADEVARLLTRGGPLMLDFDGPVCSIFAGLPAPAIAADLADLIQCYGVPLPDGMASEPDPPV